VVLAYPNACINGLFGSLLVSCCIAHDRVVYIGVTVMLFNSHVALCQHLGVILLSIYPDLIDVLSC
jgi:hypothetical protein